MHDDPQRRSDEDRHRIGSEPRHDPRYRTVRWAVGECCPREIAAVAAVGYAAETVERRRRGG